ncbi:MAG: M67 family metallopeptidase [Planctomycetes bacterium]|nr:M67 family metallopeptidase [Planctomycetota bacterium]
MRFLFLPAGVRDEIEREARRGYPYEVCGLLLGHVDATRVDVRRTLLGRNIHSTPRTAFELDPASVLAALDGAKGLDVVGFFHSHPDRPAWPSAADDQGAWEGAVTVISAVDVHGACATRGFFFEAGGFHELLAR